VGVSAVEGVVEKRTDAPPASSRSRLFALPFALAIGTVVLTYWSVDIVSPALPEIKSDLGLSAASASLIYSLLFFGRLLGNAPAALLMGRIGTSGTAICGALILVAGTLAAMVAPNGILLSSGRILQGLGISLLVNACLRAILGSKPGRGAAMTYFSFAATVGGLCGLQSGGLLTEEFGWRSVFALAAVLAAVIGIVTFIARRIAATSGGAFDPLPPAATGMVGRDHIPWAPVTFNFLVFFNYSLFVALPLYTEHEFGASPETNARLLMVITLMHLLAAFPVGRLIRTWGANRSMVAGMAVSMVGMALVLPAPSTVWIAAPLLLYGIGQVAASSAGGDIVLHLGKQSTRSISLVRFSSDLGLVIGPYLTGALADAFGYGAPFIALPAVMLATAAAAMVYARTAGAH
jgi:MFS family permease